LLTGHTHSCFQVKGYGEGEVISENTVGKLLNNLGYQGRQCVHGFRASARSILSEQGWSVEAMERQLDHKEASGTVAATPAANTCPTRKMMQQWADTCDALETAGSDTSPWPDSLTYSKKDIIMTWHVHLIEAAEKELALLQRT